jgi:hypothetical protein
VPAGGLAYLAAAIQHYKKRNPLHAVVSAGDMIGATPLISALFLDEPTIEAVNAIGIDFNAVGNHEFDKGTAELQRMRNGGCEKHTHTEPCQINRNFPGANFEFLAANVKQSNQTTLFPAFGIKTFRQGKHEIKVGFVGLTLRATPTMVTPEGIKGLRFEDEAETANALVAPLKAQGVSALVLVVHEGGIDVLDVKMKDTRCVHRRKLGFELRSYLKAVQRRVGDLCNELEHVTIVPRILDPTYLRHGTLTCAAPLGHWFAHRIVEAPLQKATKDVFTASGNLSRRMANVAVRNATLKIVHGEDANILRNQPCNSGRKGKLARSIDGKLGHVLAPIS